MSGRGDGEGWEAGEGEGLSGAGERRRGGGEGLLSATGCRSAPLGVSHCLGGRWLRCVAGLGGNAGLLSTAHCTVLHMHRVLHTGRKRALRRVTENGDLPIDETRLKMMGVGRRKYVHQHPPQNGNTTYGAIFFRGGERLGNQKANHLLWSVPSPMCS